MELFEEEKAPFISRAILLAGVLICTKVHSNFATAVETTMLLLMKLCATY